MASREIVRAAQAAERAASAAAPSMSNRKLTANDVEIDACSVARASAGRATGRSAPASDCLMAAIA